MTPLKSILFLLLGCWPALALANGTNITLAWNPVTNSDVAGYDVYYGPASSTYTNVASAGNETNYTETNLSYDSIYYFAATTLGKTGLQSPYSNEIGMDLSTNVDTNYAYAYFFQAQYNSSVVPASWQNYGPAFTNTYQGNPVFFTRLYSPTNWKVSTNYAYLFQPQYSSSLVPAGWQNYGPAFTNTYQGNPVFFTRLYTTNWIVSTNLYTNSPGIIIVKTLPLPF